MNRQRSSKRRPARASSEQKGGRPLQAPKLQTGPYSDYLPARLRTKMKYVASFSAATTSTPAQVIFTANSVFDPGNTSDTHHVVGYTQLAALYSRYRCFGCKLHVKADMEATASGIGATQVGASIVAWPSASSTVSGSYINATAQTGAKNREFNGTTRATIDHDLTVQGLTGARLIEGSDDWSGVIGAQPTRKVYWNVLWVSSVAQTNVNLNVTITLVFDVEWLERYDLALPTLSKLQHLVEENKAYMDRERARIDQESRALARRAKFSDGEVSEGVPAQESKDVDRAQLVLPADVSRLASAVMATSDKGWFMVRQAEPQTPKPDLSKVGRPP